jgi:hypothetical protein
VLVFWHNIMHCTQRQMRLHTSPYWACIATRLHAPTARNNSRGLCCTAPAWPCNGMVAEHSLAMYQVIQLPTDHYICAAPAQAVNISCMRDHAGRRCVTHLRALNPSRVPL